MLFPNQGRMPRRWSPSLASTTTKFMLAKIIWILFTGKYERTTVCHICAKCFKENNVPRKKLRHFPLAPWVHHMFRTHHLTYSMNATTNNIMWILSYCPTFKNIDNRWPDIKTKPRNLKLDVGLDVSTHLWCNHQMVNLVDDCWEIKLNLV